MPASNSINQALFLNQIKKYNCKTALDLGIGFGNIGMFLKANYPQLEIDGVEIWPAYKTPNWLLYRKIFIGDICEIMEGLPQYDAIIFADVLEHFKRSVALELFDKAKTLAKKIILISLPIHYYPQGALCGNPYEIHRTQFTEKDWLDQDCMLLGKDTQVGVFVKEITPKEEYVLA